MKISTIVKDALKRRKSTQGKMAKELGISPSTLSDLLNEKYMGWSLRHRIALYFDFDPNDLLPDIHLSCHTANKSKVNSFKQSEKANLVKSVTSCSKVQKNGKRKAA